MTVHLTLVVSKFYMLVLVIVHLILMVLERRRVLLMSMGWEGTCVVLAVLPTVQGRVCFASSISYHGVLVQAHVCLCRP